MPQCSNKECGWYAGGLTPEGKKVRKTHKCPKCDTEIHPIDMLMGLIDDGNPDPDFDPVEAVREVREGNWD